MAAASTAAAKLPGAVTYIPADRLPAVREAFRSFDTAGSGEIALSELAGVLRSLRYTVSRTELELLAERFGGPTTRLRYETVLEIVGQVHNRKRGLSALLAAFRVRRLSRSGMINGMLWLYCPRNCTHSWPRDMKYVLSISSGCCNIQSRGLRKQ